MQRDAFHGVAFEILPVDPTHHLGLLRLGSMTRFPFSSFVIHSKIPVCMYRHAAVSLKFPFISMSAIFLSIQESLRYQS